MAEGTTLALGAFAFKNIFSLFSAHIKIT